MKHCLHIILLFLLLSQTALSAPRSRAITSRDGLQSNVVSSILQDSRGIIWIGSWIGLCEYDGNSFRNVMTEDQEIFGGSPVLDIVEQTGTDYIWAASSDGVCRVNSISGQARSYLLRSSFCSGNITTEHVASSSEGRVFCLVAGIGLYLYDEDKDEMVPFQLATIDASNGLRIFCLGNDTVFMDYQNGSLVKFRYSFDEQGELSIESEEFIIRNGNHYSCIRNGRFLYVAIGDRLNEYDSVSGILNGVYDVDVHGIYDVTRTDDGRLFILYGKERICEYDPLTGISTPHPEMSSSNILFIYHSSQDVLWTGVDNHGLVEYFDDQLPVKAVFDSPKMAVNDFAEDERGNILLATQGDGLILVRDGIREKAYTASSIGLLSNDITCLEPNGEYLYVAGSGGVDICRFSNGKVTFLRNLFKGSIHVYTMAYDPGAGCLWLGTLTDGVIMVPLTEDGMHPSGKPVCYRADSGNQFSIPRDFISCLCLDRFDDEYLYVATLGGYLCHMRKSDGRAEIVSSDVKQKSIICMEYSPDGTLWLGGNGLSYVDSNGSGLSIKPVSEVPAYAIHSMSSPDEGNIWMTTAKGVSRYSASEGKFYEVADREALDNDEFLNHSSLLASDGTIYFGASDGYDMVDSRFAGFEKQKPPLLVRDFLVRGEPRNSELLSERIVLPHSDNFFEIVFSEIDFISVSSSVYYYKLEGFNDDWVSSGTSRVAVFTNVPPGKYEFKVRSNDGDADDASALKIVVKRPRYLSIVAIFIYIILICLIVGLAIYQVKLNRKKKRAALEEAAEKERQKKMFSSKLDFFTGVAKEFGSSITLIQGYADQLSERFRLPAKAVEYAHTIFDSAEKMQILIEDMSEFRDVDTGLYVPKYDKVNVASLLKMVVGNMDGSASIVMDIEQSLSEQMVQSDSNALEKIFNGIITMASRYTKAGTEIYLSLSRDQEQGIRFLTRSFSDLIADNGDLARLSDRYATLDVLRDDSPEDLGLALVRNYVSSLDGEFSSFVDGQGLANVVVTIPYGKETDRGDSGGRTDKDEELLSIASQLILVVDPDKDIRTLMTNIFNDEFRVMEAFDADSAIEAIKHNRPDIILADVRQTPGYDVNSLLQRIKGNEITRHIPIVALSYATGSASYAEGLSYSFEAMLGKPFHPNELRNTIRRILRSRSDLKDYYNSALSDIDIIAGTAVTSVEKDFSLSVVRIIQENMSDVDLTPAFLADKMCMSPISLYRKVKSVFGTTPVDLIRSIRLRNAEHLLKTTSINVSEVMFRSGFNNHSYFNKKFIEAYGMPPKKYRDSQKK